jgi:hypothetical protein
MRAVLVAAATIALLTMPAYSQNKSITGNAPSNAKPEEPKTTKADDKKYDAAVQVIGAPTKKFDPWGNVREAPKPR